MCVFSTYFGRDLWNSANTMIGRDCVPDKLLRFIGICHEGDCLMNSNPSITFDYVSMLYLTRLFCAHFPDNELSYTVTHIEKVTH